jgi:hypothetical protein
MSANVTKTPAINLLETYDHSLICLAIPMFLDFLSTSSAVAIPVPFRARPIRRRDGC